MITCWGGSAKLRRLWFQLVPESKLVKNRVHLDLTCPDVSAEVERLTGLGARMLAEHERWVTMADPEGNEFDLMPGALPPVADRPLPFGRQSMKTNRNGT